MLKFIGEAIDVEATQEPGFKQPVSFVLKGAQYAVKEVRTVWEDHGFTGPPQKHPRWWQRHHRVYYIVETEKGDVFEIYWDRKAKDNQWFLTRQLK